MALITSDSDKTRCWAPNGPGHLGLCGLQGEPSFTTPFSLDGEETIIMAGQSEHEITVRFSPTTGVPDPPQHGPPSKNMALITSPSTKWP